MNVKMELKEKFWEACKAINGNRTFDKGFNREICFMDLTIPKVIYFDEYRKEVIMLTPEGATKPVRDIKIDDNEMVVHTDYGKVSINKKGTIYRERGSLVGD